MKANNDVTLLCLGFQGVIKFPFCGNALCASVQKVCATESSTMHMNPKLQWRLE